MKCMELNNTKVGAPGLLVNENTNKIEECLEFTDNLRCSYSQSKVPSLVAVLWYLYILKRL